MSDLDRYGGNNLQLYTLSRRELQRYRDGRWLVGTKLAPIAGAAESPTLVDATPYCVIVRALICQGHSRSQLADYADVGYATIRDLHDGKASVQQRTADHLNRLLELLPETA